MCVCVCVCVWAAVGWLPVCLSVLRVSPHPSSLMRRSPLWEPAGRSTSSVRTAAASLCPPAFMYDASLLSLMGNQRCQYSDQNVCNSSDMDSHVWTPQTVSPETQHKVCGCVLNVPANWSWCLQERAPQFHLKCSVDEYCSTFTASACLILSYNVLLAAWPWKYYLYRRF